MEQPENQFKIVNDTVPKRSGIKNLLFFILLATAVVITSLFMYLKSKDVDIKSLSVNDFIDELFYTSDNNGKSLIINEVKYELDEKPVFTTYNGLVIKAIKDRVSALNEDGKEKWVIPETVSNPIVKTAGDYLLVADVGGKDIVLISGDKVVLSQKMKNNIVTADINEEGYISIIQEYKGYKGEVVILNSNGAEIRRRRIAKKFIFMSKASNDGEKFFINGLLAYGVRSEACIDLNDVNKKDGLEIKKEEVSIFTFAWFLDNNNLIAVGDSTIFSFNDKAEQNWKCEISNSKIVSADKFTSTSIALAVSEVDNAGEIAGNKTDIVIVNKSGLKTVIFTIDSRVKNIKCHSGIIAINTGNAVFYINKDGKLLSKYNSKTNISVVNFLSRKKTALSEKNSIVINAIK